MRSSFLHPPLVAAAIAYSRLNHEQNLGDACEAFCKGLPVCDLSIPVAVRALILPVRLAAARVADAGHRMENGTSLGMRVNGIATLCPSFSRRWVDELNVGWEFLVFIELELDIVLFAIDRASCEDRERWLLLVEWRELPPVMGSEPARDREFLPDHCECNLSVHGHVL
jgi:hypothetical protein